MPDNLTLGVSGAPISHSRSPELFREFFRNSKTDGSYIKVNVPGAGNVVKIFKVLGFDGMNITSPYKVDIIPYIDKLSKDARSAGAVNLIRMEGSEIIGYNTDHIGVIDSLKNRSVDPCCIKVLVLGMGGASRGAVWGLKSSGADVSISGRDPDKAKIFSKKFKVGFIRGEELKEKLKYFNLIVNTIPVKWSPFDISRMSEGSVLLNADYSKGALFNEKVLKKKKIRYISGKEWLFYQAIPSFNIFRGINPREGYHDLQNIYSESLKKRIFTGKRPAERFFITGFTGSGKTLIGKLLADRIGYDFVDIDEEIEKREKRKIADIFSDYGENYFRSVESALLPSVLGRKRVVISGGGGIVVSEKNRNAIRDKCTVIWIHRDIDKAAQLSLTPERPLIKGKKCDEIEEMFRSRLKFYHMISDFLFYNHGDPEKIALRISDDI